MKMVNPVTLALFMLISACSGQTVPDKDRILQAINTGDLSAAQADLNFALKMNPADPELHFLNARLALELGNPELAKTELKALLTNPKYADQANDMLAQAQLMSGNSRLALETLTAKPMKSGLAYAVAVDAHWAEGNFAEAMKLLGEGRVAFPDSVTLLYTDSQVAIGRGMVEQAAASSSKILQLEPKSLHGQLLAGQIALLQQRPADAERHFDVALQRNPGNHAALMAKAALAYDRGENDKAKAFLESAARSNGNSSLYVVAFLAQLAIEAGEIDRANELLQGIPGNPKSPYIVMLRGIVAEVRGQHEQAISQLVPFFSNGGENPAARFALSSAFMATGEKARAWAYLKPMADALNASPEILALASKLTAELKLPDAAKYNARQQIAAAGDPNAKDMIAADRAIRASDWKKADAIYARLLATPEGRRNPLLLNNAASVRQMLGDLDGAIKLAGEALALAPEDPLINDTLAWALFKRDGATPQVIALINKALSGQPGNIEIRMHATEIRRAIRK